MTRTGLFIFLRTAWCGCVLLGGLVLLVPSSPAETTETPLLLDKVVATVNGDIITWSEIHEARSFAREMGVDQPDDRILQDLIDRRILLQEAERAGIRVSPAEVDAAVGDIQAKYAMTDSEFHRALEGQGLTYARYRKRILGEITISRFLYREIRAKIVVSEAELFRDLEREGFDPDGVVEIRLHMILLKPGPDRDLDASRQLADEIRERIAGGEMFEELAREFSDAPSSDGSGDVGYVKKGTLRDDIAREAFSLEPGTVSNPFVVDDAVYLLRVDGKRMNDEAYRRRRAALVEEKSEAIFQELFSQRLQEGRRLASIEYPP